MGKSLIITAQIQMPFLLLGPFSWLRPSYCWSALWHSLGFDSQFFSFLTFTVWPLGQLTFFFFFPCFHLSMLPPFPTWEHHWALDPWPAHSSSFSSQGGLPRPVHIQSNSLGPHHVHSGPHWIKSLSASASITVPICGISSPILMHSDLASTLFSSDTCPSLQVVM